MDLALQLKRTNVFIAGLDLALGSGALLAPAGTLGLLGHDAPSRDAEHLFRRCGPIWLTFAAAHLVASRRGAPRDWWALAWLRGTEVATDIVWSVSPAWRPGSRVALWSAGAANAAMAAGFAWLARKPAARQSS